MTKLYLVLLAVCMQLGAFSQTDFPIGTGTATNAGTTYPCPLQDYYEGSRMQFLYRASELIAAGMTAGPITAIKFNVLDTTNTSGRPELIEQMQISIDGTTDSTLDAASWESVNNVVYGPVDYKVAKGLNVFAFSTPYIWNGTDNIVIEVCNGDPNNATTGYTAWSANPFIPWTTSLSFNGSHSYRADNMGNLCGTTTTTNSGTQTTRPNIIFDTSSCQPPGDATVMNITTTGAMVMWTPPASNPSQYLWEVRTSGAPGSGSTGLAASGTSSTPDATFTTLSPATAYSFYVRSNCGSLSSWSGAATFITECVAVASLNENFDAVAIPGLPICWSSIVRATGGSTPTVNTATGNALTTPNAVELYNSTSALSDDIILVTPPLSNAGAGTYQLTFYARNSDATQDVEVGTLDNNTSTATFTSLETVDIGTTYQKYTVSFANYSGTDMYIGIRRAGTTQASYSYVYIDNVVWEPIPACFEPTGVLHSNIDTSSAQIDWTPPVNSSPGSYHIYYSTSNTPPTASTTPNDTATNPTLILTGLNSATQYFVWVRSNCGSGSVSSWTLADSFYTACTATYVPYYEDFELATIPGMPPCTAMQNVGTGNDWVTSNNPGYGFTNNTLTYYYNSNNPADAWFYTRGLNLTAGTSYRLTFRYGNNVTATWSEKLEVKYGSSPDNASMTDLIVDYPNIQTGAAVNSETDFTPSTTGVYYLGFHVYSATNQYNLFVDDIAVTVSPSCGAPSAVIHSAVDSTSAQIDWTAPTVGSPANYLVYYSTSNTPPDSTTTPTDTTTSNPYLMTGLSPATLYYVWVRSDCGSGGGSMWSVADSFFTLCSAAPSYVPYTENFESAVVPGMPLCTSQQNPGTGNSWETTDLNNYGFNSRVLVYNYNSSSPADAWFFTRPVYLSAGISYRLTFKYGHNDSTYTEKLEVKYGSTADYAMMTDQIVDLDSITIEGSAMSATDFTPATSGVYYLGFHVYSATNQYNLYVDDIQLTETPAVPVTLSSFTGHREGTVNVLSWTTASEANSTGFELQRSADGRNFSKIAFVGTKAVEGNSSLSLSYGYNDVKPFAGTTYYRLKQMDKDGRYRFSNVVTIRGTRAGELVLSSVYPNPATSKLNVVLNAPANDEVAFVFTDLAGKVVMQHQKQLISGDNNIVLDIASLPSGSYMLKAVCSNGCKTAVTKVVKK